MKVLKKLCDYFFYCGIGKDEYNKIKKDAYVSNFIVWRILHVLIAVVFLFLFVVSLFDGPMVVNRWFYLASLLYFCLASILFFFLKKDSLIAQLLIYLSISWMFIFGCLITQNKPDSPAVTFIAVLLVAPMFMIDKPFFMAIELCSASAVFLIWMHGVKPHDVWMYDLMNVIPFTIVGCFLNVIANAVRIREFVLTRKIHIQKDTDDLTGLKNKGALTREINEYIAGRTDAKGIMFLLDANRFKSINDTYGHDTGDQVIAGLGEYLRNKFNNGEVAGRFGGDEFIIFVKDNDDPDAARKIAADIATGASQNVRIPDTEQNITVSIGVYIFKGLEKNYSEIIKKADKAMYKAKSDPDRDYCFYEE